MKTTLYKEQPKATLTKWTQLDKSIIYSESEFGRTYWIIAERKHSKPK